MSDTFVPDPSFGLPTCNFNAEYPDPQRSRRADSLISVRNLPFGGGVVVQSGGIGAMVDSYTVYVANQTDLAHLQGARGYHGTLTIYEGSYQCTLQTVTSRTFYLNQSQDVILVLVRDT